VTKLRLSRIFWMGAAAILVAAAFVALVAVLRGDLSDTDGRILGTLAAALLAGSTLVAGLALVERDGRILGWTAVAVSVPAFAALLYPIWDYVFEADDDSWRWGWLGALALVAGLIAVTARLLAGTSQSTRLARVAGVLAAIAATVSAVAIWRHNPGEALGRAVAVAWILTGLCYLLVPVLQRLEAPRIRDEGRVLSALDGVELVATRSGGVDPRLEPGERLALRRRS
jgi:hypothetical protein